MGPPSRPSASDNKATDLNELGDVLFGVGVDLREEDAALLRSSANNAPSLQDQLSEAAYQSHPNAKYPFSRDNYNSHNIAGGKESFYGAGNLNQPTGPNQSEALEEAARDKEIRRKAAISSYHLNAPFLSPANLRRRLQKGLNNYQVKIDDTGLFRAQDQYPVPRKFAVAGPDKNEIIKVVRGQDLLRHDAPYAELLTMLSLATEERLRMFVEDAATLAKGRRVGSHGLIPRDLANVAVGGEAMDAFATLPTPSSATPPKINPLKRTAFTYFSTLYANIAPGSYAEANTPLTPVSNNSQPSKPSPNPVVEALQKIQKAERAQEEERLAKRKRREAAANASLTSGGGSGASTPGSLGESAADMLEPKKGVLKKDLKKAETLSNTQALNASNKTMNMALGGKKLSWMSKGDTGHTNPFLPKRSNASLKATAEANGVGNLLPKNRVYGAWREDRETGKGIQLRDMVSVLENDGKEKKALQIAYGKMGSAAAPPK